jgi:hypothetical protein
MRLNRAVSLFMAMILMAGTLSLALVSPSQASSGHAATAVKARTKVSINFAANGAKSFQLYGKVTPKANKKTATLQRASKANGHYGKFRTTKTNKQGKYSFGGLKKEGFYKVKIGNATSKVIHVCKGGCG